MTITNVSHADGISFEDARLRIARMHVTVEKDLRSLWSELSTMVMDAMRIDRLGVWVISEEGAAARCRFLSQRSNGDTYHGAVLRARDFPEYFSALSTHRVIVADDAMTSPLTAELRSAYLEPLGITSMLDAPLFDGGIPVGVVCHEHIGPPREWSIADQNFAMAVADNISRLYQEHLRVNAEISIRGLEEHLAQLHRMEAIGRMAAGIAHDFRGVLGAMNGFIELTMRVPGLPPDAARLLKQISMSSQRGYDLIKQVNDFGREDATAPRVVDVRAVVDSLTPMIKVLASSQVNCNFVVNSPVSRVFMDPGQLERVLVNLVLNARDAMAEGGTLTIEAADMLVKDNGGDQGTYVSITVSDTGQGMDEDTCKQIMQPFFTTKGELGTGLGLAIVDQIVSRTGGFVRFNSVIGKGTEASVYLPRIASPTQH